MENIKSYFNILLIEKDAAEASLEELVDCLQPENAVERIMYRREVGTNNRREFMRIGRGESGQAASEKKKSSNDSSIIGFKHTNYEVSEANGHCAIVIEKRINAELTFKIKTFDGSAKAGEKYKTMDEVFTMKEGERELEIKIGIIDDPEWQPDEDFTVHIIDENTQERFEGDDTICTVLILDEDKPGNIGFAETSVTVSRKDEIAYI